MRPIAARVLITLIVLAFVIGASVFVNSGFHGSFAAGIIVLVPPFLALSFSLRICYQSGARNAPAKCGFIF